MPASTVKSTAISNFEASPLVLTNVGVAGGRDRVIMGTVEVTTAQMEDDDIVLFAPIPTAARITSIRIFSDALAASALAVDVGLFNTDGTVKDRDAYASAITDLQAGSKVGVEVMCEARDINNIGERVWEDAADTTDPGGFYYIGLQVETVGGTPAAGTISWVIRYTID